MTDTAGNSRTTYMEGMKWALALAIAAVAGAFLHLSDLSKLPGWLKILAAVASAGFLIAIFFGVHYLIRLFTDDVRRQELAEIEAKKNGTDEDKARAAKLRGKLGDSDKSRPWLYRTQVTASVVASALALVFLPFAILQYKDDPKKPEAVCCPPPCCARAEASPPGVDRFAVVYSAVHRGRGGERMQHTFLLDKQTGKLWQMICQKNGTVAFQETLRIEAK